MIDQKFQNYLASLGPLVTPTVRKALVVYFRNTKLNRGQIYARYLRFSDIPKGLFYKVVRPILRDFPVNRAASLCWAKAVSEKGISIKEISAVAASVRQSSKERALTPNGVIARLRLLASHEGLQVYINDLGIPPQSEAAYQTLLLPAMEEATSEWVSTLDGLLTCHLGQSPSYAQRTALAKHLFAKFIDSSIRPQTP